MADATGGRCPGKAAVAGLFPLAAGNASPAPTTVALVALSIVYGAKLSRLAVITQRHV